MGKLLLFLINPCIPLAVYIIGCNTGKRQESQNSQGSQMEQNSQGGQTNDSIVNYETVKKDIVKAKAQIKAKIKNKPQASYLFAAKDYINLFDKKMAAAWMGTPWDFNGITKTPKKGNIACGYFVTTTLAHMDFPIDIAKYAQCGSDVMVKYLVKKENYHLYNSLSYADFIKTLKSRRPFVGIIGLDFHTGYLLNDGKEVYFIHSSYKNRRGVVKEIALESKELASSKWRSVGFITEDEGFMKKWITK
jgi:hypothetical protein